MKIILSSDWHQGLTRGAHTTPESAARLRARLKQYAVDVLDLGDTHFIIGDLLDTYSNSEAVLLEVGVLLMDFRVKVVMAGNHDVKNSATTISSFALLEQFLGGEGSDKHFINNAVGDCEPTQLIVGNTCFIFVPHVSSAELFSQALQKASTLARNSLKYNVLCLHANYDLGREVSETTLVLTQAAAVGLLQGPFHRIVMGHEHTPRDLLDGRLHILGNLFPTSFADLGPKRVLELETDDCTVRSLALPQARTWKGPISRLESNPLHNFLDLDDDLPAGEAFAQVTRLFKELPDIMAIRLNAPQTLSGPQTLAAVPVLESLPQVIAADLKTRHPDLSFLWEELSGKVLTADNT